MKKPSPPSPGKPSPHTTPIDSPLMKRGPMRLADQNPGTVKTEASRKVQAEHILPYSDRPFIPQKKNAITPVTVEERTVFIGELVDQFSNVTDLDKIRSLTDAELSLLRRLQKIKVQAEKRKQISPSKENKGFSESENVRPSQLEINKALTDLLDRMNVKGEARAESIASYYNSITGRDLAPLGIQPHVMILDDVPKWESVKDTGISPRAFIETAYKDYLGKGLTQADIHRRDKELYRALHNWLRKKENTLDGLQLPTKAEARRQQLEGRTADELRALRGLANSAAYKLG